MRVFTKNDRVRVELAHAGGVVAFLLKPLSVGEKAEVMESVRLSKGEALQSGYDMARKAIKFSLVAVEGFTNSSGGEYQVTKDADGKVSDDSISDLLNMPLSAATLIRASTAMIQGIPSELIDTDTGKPLENVKVSVEAKKD